MRHASVRAALGSAALALVVSLVLALFTAFVSGGPSLTGPEFANDPAVDAPAEAGSAGAAGSS